MNRIALFGLDSLPLSVIQNHPELFPFLNSLLQKGQLKAIRSCDPPITIPAWSVISTGKDPGELGVYGFHSRLNRQSLQCRIPDASLIKEPRIWDLAGPSFVFGVPQTYPYRIKNGLMGGDILQPAGQSFVTDLEAEFLALDPEPVFDIPNYRTEDPQSLYPIFYKMLRFKHQIVKTFLPRPYRFFQLVLIETDRLQHAFWKYHFKDHPRYVDAPEPRQFLRDFYLQIDAHLAFWFALAKASGYQSLVLSDHGARTLKGLFFLNRFLIQKGYLVLKGEGELLNDENIDWSKTKAYADGGYCGRIYFNLEGRDPSGFIVDQEALFDQLTLDLQELAPQLQMNFELRKPETIYRAVRRIAPDVLLYAGNLDYRISARIGAGDLFSLDNDTGADGVNHDEYGIIGGDLDFSSVHSIADIFDLLKANLCEF